MGSVFQAAAQMVKDAPEKVRDYSNELINDPGRLVMAAGTAGGSEMIREGGVAIQQKMQSEAQANAPKAPDMPAMPTEPKTPAEDKKDPDAARQRGRASTILSGRRGISASPSTARRTLMGV